VLKINNVSILLFNSYMPCDTTYNCDIFQNILNDISCIYSKYEYIDYVIIGGDLNTDLRRVTSVHAQTLNVFRTKWGAEMLWYVGYSPYIVYVWNVAASTETIIDHFIVSEICLEIS